jgi:hypothetical protein
MLIAGGVVSGAAGLLGALEQARTLKGQAKIAEANAKLLNIQAEDEALIGAQQTAQATTAVSRAVAANVSATVGAGIDVGGATAREVILSTELAGIEDIIEIGRNSRRRVWAKRTEAALQRAQGKELRQAAKTTKTLAPLQAVAPIVSGFSSARIASARQGA